MKFYFVRHGQSVANATGIIADKSSRLTENGLKQAAKTGKELAGKDITKILSSPYIRAQQTARVISAEIRINEIVTVEELRERGLGGCENMPKDMESDNFFTFDAERGFERHKEVIARAHKAITVIKKEAKTGTVLVVGHAIFGFFLMQVANGHTKFEDFEDFHQIGNADYIEVEF